MPVPNSYWVRPGRLLAGEYPGAAKLSPNDRIQRLLRAGVTSFFDLTCEGELAPYESSLPADVRYQRWPITDHELPESPQFMSRLLDALDDELADGHCVYVHCRAGIGRTGTIIGCHLIRGGLEPYVALDELQRLWQQCARSTAWPSTPETDEQYRFVLEWREPGKAASNAAERCEGALLGLACGEGIATLVVTGKCTIAQATSTSIGPDLSLEAGPNTLMTVAVADSLFERGGHDAQDQMRRYVDIARTHGSAFSPDLRRALATWQWSRKPNAGSHDPKNLDPHSLTRSLAAALYRLDDPVSALDLAADISRTTQQSPVVLDLCRVWTAVLLDAVRGASREDLVRLYGNASQSLLARKLRPELDAVLGGRGVLSLRDGDAISVTARALRAFGQGNGLMDGFGTSLDGAAPTVSAALLGALAGAYWGSKSLPAAWLRALPLQNSMRTLARRFAV